MARISQVDWSEVRQDYIRDTRITQDELAKKWGLTYHQVKNKAHRENWARARENYTSQFAERLQKLAIRSDAPTMLQHINTKQLRTCARLRVLLHRKLWVKRGEEWVEREEVTIPEARLATAAFAEIYRMERLALGASTDNLAVASTSASRYDNMTEEELMAELREVRERVGIE